MSSFYSQDVDIDGDSYGFMDDQMLSPDGLTRNEFTMSPDMNELLLGHGGKFSPSISPSISPLEVGSAPTSFPMLDLQNSMAQDSLWLNTLSHSYPRGPFQHNQIVQGAVDFGSCQEQEQEDQQVWMGAVFHRGEDTESYSYPPGQDSTISSAPTDDIDFKHTPAGWATSATSMARTESVFSHNSVGSFNSFDDFQIEPIFDDYTSSGIPVEAVNMGQWSAVTSATDSMEEDAATPKPIPTGDKNPGRKGKLTPAQRDHAAYIRKIGACQLCRLRRAKCDGGIPCSACKRYYRKDPSGLDNNPCRGEALMQLGDLIMHHNAFPKGPYQRFLGKNFSIEKDEHRIYLDLGFGHYPFPCRVKLVRAKENAHGNNPYFHKHVEYPWPPAIGNSEKHLREDMVFPAILIDTQRVIAAQVEAHLGNILADKRQFQYFPIWQSPLKVLRIFYKYYLSLPANMTNPLKQAFQLLMLVHVGGELRLSRDDPTIKRINDKFFPGFNHEHVLPCFIRAQLGPIFSQVAHRLMGDVLKQLEKLSSVQDPAHFPMIISTFSVLFMALESLQFHFAKLAFHSNDDCPSAIHAALPPTRDLKDFDGADILLRFYASTSCHAQLKTLVDIRPSASTRTACPRYNDNFLDSLGDALRSASSYLESKDTMDLVVDTNNMSCFFDRLLAKMYRLPPQAT